MTFTAVGPGLSANTFSFTLTPKAVGDFIIFEAVYESATAQVTALTSSNISWSVLVGPTLVTGFSPYYCTVFIGQVTSATAATCTVTTTNGNASTIRCAGQEFNSSAGFANVLLDTSAGTGSASTTAYPSLTPTRLVTGELYFGYAVNANSAVAGSTAGYTYFNDANTNGACFNPNCTNLIQAPTWSDTDQRVGLAVLLYERPSPPTVPSLPAGYVVQATDLNELSACAQFLMAKPYAHISDQTGASSIIALSSGGAGVNLGGVTAALIGNGTSGCIDTDGMYTQNIAGNQAALNINTPGWYMCRYGLRANSGGGAACISGFLWFILGSSNPLATFYTNGIALYLNTGVKDGLNDPMIISGGGLCPIPLYPGDTVALTAYCDSGTAATVVGSGTTAYENTFIEAEWVSTV